MCLGGGGGGDGGAKDIQERQEELERQRQDRIRAGADLINENFKQFDDGFFNDFQNRFLNFFEPQLDQQSAAARGKATAALRDRGINASTEGIRALTDLQERDALERTNLGNKALDEANRLRGSLEREKSNLFSLNEASADPERIAPLATGAAASFAAPNAFDPLEDVFGGVLNSFAAFQAARNNSVTPVARRNFSISGVSNSPTGSGRVVG